MKRNILVEITQYLNKFKNINSIERVDDTVLKIFFNKKETLYFDLKRGDSYIFKKDNYTRLKNYSAPFDIILKKRFTNSSINRVELMDGNKILRFFTESSSKYKSQKTILQFEFTGRNTNIIILDENGVILEALRHIDSGTSFREVKVGVMLKELPPMEFKADRAQIDDMELFLRDEYLKRELNYLSSLKKQKILQIEKKEKKLKFHFDKLEDEKVLLEKSKRVEYDANLVLSHIHVMKNYQKELDIIDFDGVRRVVILPLQAMTPAQAGNMLFKKAKKLKQKAKYAHIERENLEGKLTFLKRLKDSIKSAQSIDEVNLYLPKQKKQQKKRDKVDSNIENFFIEGYKISLGKSEKGNISLLKDAKMSDIWVHLKDLPSTHVIIRNSKKTAPESVILFAAKLCVQFSVNSSGSYLVDYTQRRNVKMRDGANVNYVEYKTLILHHLKEMDSSQLQTNV